MRCCGCDRQSGHLACRHGSLELTGCSGEPAERIGNQDRECCAKRQIATVQIDAECQAFAIGAFDFSVDDVARQSPGQRMRRSLKLQLPGLRNQHIVEPDMSHQRRCFVLLRDDWVFQYFALIPLIATANGIDRKDVAGRQCGGQRTMQNYDRIRRPLFRKIFP